MAHRGAAAVAGLALFAASATCAAAETLEVDVEIVLAVDGSTSIDRDELAIERSGYMAALTHPDLVQLIRTGHRGRIAVAYFEYARAVQAPTVIAWRVIDSAAAARALAGEIGALPARPALGTSISRAIEHGLALIADPAISGDRQVIDIAGDGPNNSGRPVEETRDRAAAAGVTVNGLPILIRPSRSYPAIDRYFAACVIGGPGAFLLPVVSSEDLAATIRRKLMLEIAAAPPPARLIPAADAGPVDCMIGERLRDADASAIYPGLYE
jgi:hypothetical protein